MSYKLLNFLQQFPVKKIRKKGKKKYTDLMWFDRLPMSTGRRLSLYLKLRLHKKVFILIFK